MRPKADSSPPDSENQKESSRLERINLGGSPIVEARVIGSRADVTVEGILDTGFMGHLCLPITTAVSLGLELNCIKNLELADGTILESEPVFLGRMEWDSDIIDVDILLTKSDDALFGTDLLRGMELKLDYSTNELVIEKANNESESSA